MEQNKTSKKKYIFLDTCIIQVAGSSNKSKSEAVISYLKEVVVEGFSLVISEYSIYENLQGLWGKRAVQAEKILEVYETKQVDKKVLLMASVLQGLYHDEKYENVSDGDKIIAATACLENGFILTYNHKDFPSPFFIPERLKSLTYKAGSYNQTIDLALYKPNLSLIGRRVSEKA